MKKLLAMAVVAVGMIVGASSASADYPPDSPIITTPISVGAGEMFDAVVSGLEPGDKVTLVFNGETYTATVGADGKATFSLTAPKTPGDYPITAYSDSGWKFETSVKVVPSGNKPDKPNDKPGGKLPATGSDIVMPGVGFGLAAVAGGMGLLFVSKRRRNAAV